MRFVVYDGEGEAIILASPPNGDSIGVFLLEGGVEGWFGSPAPREDVLERTLSDGDYPPSSLTQGARSITLHGIGRFNSSLDAARFRDRLLSIMFKNVVVKGEEPGGSRECEGFVSDDPDPVLMDGDRVVQFSLIVTCPDPKKYGEAHKFRPKNGQVEVINDGNATTWPIVKVDGAVHNLTISHGIQQVKWSGSANGLTIDFRDMSVSSGSISIDNAFEIPPGKTKLTVSTDGDLSVIVRPAWR